MTPSDVEAVYEAVASTLDGIAPEQRELFLAKLVLLLAHDLGDAGAALARIAEAAQDLDA